MSTALGCAHDPHQKLDDFDHMYLEVVIGFGCLGCVHNPHQKIDVFDTMLLEVATEVTIAPNGSVYLKSVYYQQELCGMGGSPGPY